MKIGRNQRDGHRSEQGKERVNIDDRVPESSDRLCPFHTMTPYALIAVMPPLII